MTPAETASRAAEAVRALNHLTRPGVAEVDVVDVYDLVAELTLMTGRLPQLLGQLERLVDALVEDGRVRIVEEGGLPGDPVVAAAVCGHWLTAARAAAGEVGHALDQAQQVLASAAVTDVRPSSS